MCYAIDPGSGHLVRAALLSVPEYCPSQQLDGRVPVLSQQYEEVLGITWAGKVG